MNVPGQNHVDTCGRPGPHRSLTAVHDIMLLRGARYSHRLVQDHDTHLLGRSATELGGDASTLLLRNLAVGVAIPAGRVHSHHHAVWCAEARLQFVAERLAVASV